MGISRPELLEIAKGMASGNVKYLHDLRKEVVDLDLTTEATKVDKAIFLSYYFSKKLTEDIWENLATDASFEFNEDKLSSFTAHFGEILIDVLAGEEEIQSVTERLGELARWLYLYFHKISLDPSLIGKGGQNELTIT